MASNASRYEAVEPHMGTLVGVTVWARSVAEAQAGFAAAFALARALNLMLSDYLPDSELNSIGVAPRRVSPELYRVLAFARKMSEASGGAFDVTVGPLTRLWRARAPLTEEARALVDWRALHLEGGRVWVERAGMRLDLGAIGKGFAADEMVRVLRGMGLERVLVAASGDIVCWEAPPGERGWKVGAGGARLTLRRTAVSTSGDSTQFYEEGGKRYSHIVDPRRGAALTEVLEVSVVAANGMTADALATTVRVMGVEASAGVLKKFGGRVVGDR